MYNTASELYNDFLGIFSDDYNELSDTKRNNMKHEYHPMKLFLKHIVIISGLKMKYLLIQQEKVIKKNRLIQQKLMKHLLIYHQYHR